MKKRVFYTELCYVFGIIIMAFGAAFSAHADLGMSMVVAPAYILHLEISKVLPWFSFGVAEYCVQGLILVLLVMIVRQFRWSYLFSFVTALIYGTVLDGAIRVVSFLPNETLALRVVCFALGAICCSIAVSLFFHTYIPPESYELITKEIAHKFSFNINRVKTSYDCISTVISIALSFAFFGFGVFKGVGIGTIICALVNGTLIGQISRLLEHFFRFENRFKISIFSK